MRHREAVAARVGRRWAPIGKDEECHVRHINHMESGGHISKRHKNERRTADVADKKERAPGGDGAACAGPRGAAPSRSSIELFAADRLLWADR